MIAYLYAIADRPGERLPDQAGLDDMQLAEVPWHDIAAIVTTHEEAPSSTRLDHLWRHEDVIEALMERRTVLPAQFGTVLPSFFDIVDILSRSHSRFVEDLKRLRGCVEVGVRFLPRIGEDAPVASPVRPTDESGTAFLRAKLAQKREFEVRRDGLLNKAREIQQRLDWLAQASHIEPGKVNQNSISAAFLVPRPNVETFRLAVGEIAEAQPEITLLCTGPWPPYSFVSADEPTVDGNRHDSVH